MPMTPLLTGFRAGLPIALSYIPLAMAFGLIGLQAGLTTWQTVIVSSVVYAGASQFASLRLWQAGGGALEILFATLLINLRFFLVSMTLSMRFHHSPYLSPRQLRWLPLPSAGVTDHTFILASMLPLRELTPAYFFGLNIGPYITWVVSTWAGAALNALVPATLGASMQIAVYALFAALLVPSIQKERHALYAAAAGALAHTVLQQIPPLVHWSLLLASIIGALVGCWTMPDRPEQKQEASSA